MKKLIIIAASLTLILAIAAGIWSFSTLYATPPLPDDLRDQVTEQDWTAITHGNWSPWHTTTDGETTWDPVTSYNEWIASLSDGTRAWPAIIDIHYANLEHLSNEYIGLNPEDDEWSQTRAFLEQDQTQVIIEQRLHALDRPHLGHGLYNATSTYSANSTVPRHIQTRDPDDFAAMKRHLSDENPQLVGDDTSTYRLASAGLPAAGQLRQVANLLTSQSCLELLNGNTDQFIELQQIISESSRYCNEFPTDTNQLVANAIKSTVNRTVRWAVDSGNNLNDDQLARLDTIVLQHESTDYNHHGESLLFHDTVRRLVNSSGELIQQDYEATIDDLVGNPSDASTNELSPDVLRLLLLHNLIQQALADDIAGRASNTEREAIIQSERPHLSRRADLLLTHAEQQFMSSSFTRLQTDSKELRWSIAARRHELRHGEPPAGQSDIDSDLQPIRSSNP